jgi:SAM-dependent methyltransferase
MQDQTWADGYVVDIGYTHGFYRELTPALLRFVTVLGELESVPDGKPYTYYELGCGNGMSTVLLAAANPLGRFIGVDFNPTHIHNARHLAQQAGVANVEFLEKSFAELVAIPLEDADFITLHGVWSWISAENRGLITDFIRARLKPAGIAYISYNCLPGHAQLMPLQRLLVDRAGQGAGPLGARIEESVKFAQKLEKAGAAFFRMSPLGRARLASITKQDPSYLAHEYYNEHWAPFYHADVAHDLGEAKLTYCGSASLIENFDPFILSAELLAVVADAPNRTAAETLKDFAFNRVFRKDVFTRGAPKAPPKALDALLGGTRFALARPRRGCKLKEATPAGELTLEADTYVPALDALARQPMTFDEMCQSPELAGRSRAHARQALFGMAALGNVLPALPARDEAQRRAATARFNDAVLAQPPSSRNLLLASPVLGTGISLNLIDRLLLQGPRKHGDAVEHALKAFLQMNAKARRGDKPIESTADTRVMIDERAAFFFSDLLPYLRLVGVAEG